MAMCFFSFISVQTLIPINASPLLGGDDEQIVEEEEVDGSELGPHVEESTSFGHFLQLTLLLQKSILRDDWDGLMRTEAKAETFTSFPK